jgi:beta-glucanase (GH16 family)
MEIDGFEILGGSSSTIRQTVHNGDGSNAYSISPIAAIDTGFHTVGVDWQASLITFYVDGVQTGQVATPTGGSNNFHQPAYINIGLAVAGSTSWGGGTPVNMNLVDPGTMQIDYVGVWPSFAAAYSS